MEEEKNLVRDFLLEQKIIDPDKFEYSYFYENIEWFVFKLSDDTIQYVSYELTPHGLGYAFCATVTCTPLSFNVVPVFYSKSYTNDTKGEWTTISDHFRDKLISDTIGHLNIWKQ